MSHRSYIVVSGTLFCIVAIAHLLRILYQLPMVVEDYSVPMFFSWVGLIVPALLAVWAYGLARASGAT